MTTGRINQVSAQETSPTLSVTYSTVVFQDLGIGVALSVLFKFGEVLRTTRSEGN